MIPKFKTIKTTTLIENKYIKVFQDDVTLEDESKFDYYYISTPNGKDYVNVIGITADKRELILTKQYRYPIRSEIVQSCGGLIENEESATEAALREFREETGYEGSEIISLGTSYIDPSKTPIKLHEFLILDCVKKYSVEFSNDEIIEAYSIKLDSAWELIKGNHINNNPHTISTIVKALLYLKIYPK
ncbi:NUDIX hydrolase [Candidatus Dojkabacteria bacterium]|nr:NUDIX hydrolase [Candidatus Dojkabacteria bacterium]